MGHKSMLRTSHSVVYTVDIRKTVSRQCIQVYVVIRALAELEIPPCISLRQTHTLPRARKRQSVAEDIQGKLPGASIN